MLEKKVNLGAEPRDTDENQSDMNKDTNQGEQNEKKTYTQDELKELLQAEGDRRAEQALKTFKEKDLPKEIAAAKTEAGELAQMDAKQRAEHEKAQREERLTQREKEISRKELKIEAHGIFMERQMPIELLEVIDYSDADTCFTSIDLVEKAFNNAVQKGINDKFRGSAPKATVPATALSYAEELAKARKANDNISAIRIKQEAAQSGEILI